MRKIIFVLLICFNLCFISVSVDAQVTQQWVARYNGPANSWDEAHVIAVDSSGNVYVSGQSFGIQYDYATIKYNSSGVQQWVARYNGPGNNQDLVNSIAVDGSGNVYITGSSVDIWTSCTTIKYNSLGVQQWIQRYGSEGTGNSGKSLAVDGSGNVYVTGYSQINSSRVYIITMKYNTDGVQQWIRKYSGPANTSDEAVSLVLDNLGNVIVTGYSEGIGTAEDFVVIKYNSLGIQQWTARYNGPANGYDEPSSLAVDPSGNIYVSGESPGIGTNSDYATVKYNSSGIEQWVQRYNGPGNGPDYPTSIGVDASGNVYVTGSSGQYRSGKQWIYDYCTIKYNSSGIQQWTANYNGPGNLSDNATSLTLDNLGYIYVTGSSNGSGTGVDYATIKYNSSGTQQWVQRYNGPGNSSDVANSISVDASYNVYLTGYSWGNGTLTDYTTIKYSQLVGIRKVDDIIPKSFSLLQNYPNPFNPSTKIKFSIPLSRGMAESRGVLVKLKIYDILGKEVNTLVNEELKPGSYEVNWNASNYPSGIYYYKLIAGDFTETKKMVLIK